MIIYRDRTRCITKPCQWINCVVVSMSHIFSVYSIAVNFLHCDETQFAFRNHLNAPIVTWYSRDTRRSASTSSAIMEKRNTSLRRTNSVLIQLRFYRTLKCAPAYPVFIGIYSFCYSAILIFCYNYCCWKSRKLIGIVFILIIVLANFRLFIST